MATDSPSAAGDAKATATQIDVLRRMREGWVLSGGLVGVHVRYELKGPLPLNRKRIGRATFQCLIDRYLIEAGRRDGGRVFYGLTHIGRAAALSAR